MKKLFCYLYNQWLSKFVDSKDDLLVKFIDYQFAGKCSYCVHYRVAAYFLGIGILFYGGWVTVAGISLIAISLLMTLGEKYWLCNPEKEN
jgi:hypothetical protein